LLNVIIGARSALFSPLPNIGLIVADECHDSSYYQADPPFYHAVTTAQTYARLAGAVCILGSATPTVVQRYQAEWEGDREWGMTAWNRARILDQDYPCRGCGYAG
jgi:primosomal protein N' (replication factor Y)